MYSPVVSMGLLVDGVNDVRPTNPGPAVLIEKLPVTSAGYVVTIKMYTP
jgi:hypothetical protein